MSKMYYQKSGNSEEEGGGGGFHDYEILGDMGGNAFLNLRKQGGLKHGTRQ